MISKAVTLKYIVDECQEDYVELWSIVKKVQRTGVEPSKLRESTLEILEELLNSRKIVAGDFTGKNHEFRAHTLSPVEIIAMIDREWKKLGRLPTIGEIIAFTSPIGLPETAYTAERNN